jgi:ABC-type transport system substrate-binding protein
VNFQSTTGNGPIIRQLYFREALAYLMNQSAVIQGPLRGYGALTVGPVGSTPATQFLSPLARQRGDPFPYNPGKAKSLLVSHGWSVVPNVSFGNGWSYSPDFLPTGDEVFMCGAINNFGGYCDPADDALINKTLTSSNLQYMYSWQDYLTPQLPVMWHRTPPTS